MVKDRTLLEKLAALEHEQWIEWARTVAESETGISATRLARWEQYFVPYDQLTEEVKEYDRAWARKIIEVINSA